MIRAWTQNAIDKYEPEKDGKFSLFSGNIQGTFMQFVMANFVFCKTMPEV